MKKFLMIALLVGAIPAVAFSQTVTCDDCSHVVSVYMGEGGLIATADGADMVTYVATCEGVTRSGELAASDDGVVRTLLTMDNGLACSGDDEDNEFQLGPITDGGWYWITDDSNSAVGNLVGMDVLENDATDITSAGDGVAMTMGKGAVYLKEVATGRVGILPNILPEVPMVADPVNTCSYTGTATKVRETKSCMLGDGGTVLRVQGPANVHTGKRDEIMANGTVTRPGVSGVTIAVTVDLWGNGTGHFTSAEAGDATLGHKGGTPLATTLSASLAATGPGTGTDLSSQTAGLTFAHDTSTNVGTLSIVADTDYCSATADHSATVTFSAGVDSGQIAQVTPSIGATAAGVAATHKIQVVCPAASANMGQELVPENPFPTDK